MLAGLRNHGADVPLRDIMRQSTPLAASLALPEAVSLLRNQGVRAEAVVDGGRVVGMLTLENIGEMMMIENARPGFRFGRPN
jgi:CBS domain-containing protein